MHASPPAMQEDAKHAGSNGGDCSNGSVGTLVRAAKAASPEAG